MKIPSSLMEGVFRRRSCKTEQGVASPAAARTATLGGPDPDRQALRLGAGSRCRLRFHCRGKLRGSLSENRHGGAPREVPVAPGQGGRASQARPEERVRLSALHPPLIGGTELLKSRRPPAPKPSWARPADARVKAPAKRRTNPGAATRRGNEQIALFDIVNTTTANGSCASRDFARVLSSRVPGERSKTRDLELRGTVEDR